MGYEHLENRGTRGTRLPDVEVSDHTSNPTVNGELGTLNDDDDGDNDDGDNDYGDNEWW